MPTSFSKIYEKSKRHPNVDLCGKYEVLKSVKVDFEGRSVSQSQYVIDDPCTRYKGIKPSDFSLENQLAVGVTMSPVRCSLQRSEIESQIEASMSIGVNSK